ncbi:MAG: type II restriction endonuclease [Candidatus Micrarchaeota archaeon]|nr:type II restriction endonuclease [Candidatus Micrarchaeota archaeon]
MKYNELGYPSEEAYFNDFFNSLLVSNRDAAFFVNWEKVFSHVMAHLEEISLLNCLVNIKDYNERKLRLESILKKYPKTRQILPLIIATRENNLDLIRFSKEGSVSFLSLDFNKSNLSDVIQFCEESGIIELLGRIKDLYSYLTGVEVGMDTNARKNRSGFAYEDLVFKHLKKKGIDIRKTEGIFEFERSKKPDFVIYKDNKIVAVVEVFFAGVGSKPLETIQSFINLQKAVKEKNIKFIFITDGPVWQTKQEERKRALEKLDYPLNLRLASNCLRKILC